MAAQKCLRSRFSCRVTKVLLNLVLSDSLPVIPPFFPPRTLLELWCELRDCRTAWPDPIVTYSRA
jgi:hypothetical protein